MYVCDLASDYVCCLAVAEGRLEGLDLSPYLIRVLPLAAIPQCAQVEENASIIEVTLVEEFLGQAAPHLGLRDHLQVLILPVLLRRLGELSLDILTYLRPLNDLLWVLRSLRLHMARWRVLRHLFIERHFSRRL